MAYCSVVDIKHKGIGAFDEYFRVLVLGVFHQSDRVDGVLGQRYSILLESRELLFNIIFKKISVAFRVAIVQVSQLSLKSFGVEYFSEFNTGSLVHVRVYS